MDHDKDDLLARAIAGSADISAALSAADVMPEPPPPPPGQVTLPGGLPRGGKVHRTAVVRELNGSDEEALSKALASGSLFRFMDTLIERGTEMIGDLPATRELLKTLLIGDRDELAVAIRIATYGDEVVIEGWQCPHCQGMSDISFSLAEDVGRRVLDDPAADGVFDVALRKGAKVRVRLPNGEDQDALFENPEWTAAQRNTVLLSRCVMTYTGPDGQDVNIRAFPRMVLDLSIPDRQAVISQVAKRQPGPRYNEVKFTHAECGKQVVLALGVTDLFRDLIAFL